MEPEPQRILDAPRRALLFYKGHQQPRLPIPSLNSRPRSRTDRRLSLHPLPLFSFKFPQNTDELAMSDVLKPSRVRPPPEISDLSPPLSPKSDKPLLNEKIDKSYVPADIDIPDNYVQYTLKNTKPRPPVTWSNFLTELDYVNVAVLTITPSIAIWGLVSGVPLRWQTALFAVFYYYVTGLGITAGALYIYYY